MQKRAYHVHTLDTVDIENFSNMNITLQKSASIQPRTDCPKFGEVCQFGEVYQFGQIWPKLRPERQARTR